MSPHGFYTFDVLRQPFAADLHLDGAESLGEIILGLPQQLVEGEIEIYHRHSKALSHQIRPEDSRAEGARALP